MSYSTEQPTPQNRGQFKFEANRIQSVPYMKLHTVLDIFSFFLKLFLFVRRSFFISSAMSSRFSTTHFYIIFSKYKICYLEFLNHKTSLQLPNSCIKKTLSTLSINSQNLSSMFLNPGNNSSNYLLHSIQKRFHS